MRTVDRIPVAGVFVDVLVRYGTSTIASETDMCCEQYFGGQGVFLDLSITHATGTNASKAKMRCEQCLSGRHALKCVSNT